MTTEELQEAFTRHEEEYLQFKHIKKPLHRRPDICAFIMLDEVVPAQVGRTGKFHDMVSAAEHDEIYLDVDAEALAKVATDDLIKDLTRCGVRYSSEFSCLAMFV